VGRFVEQKSHKQLRKIFANYRRRYPSDNAQLVWVGDGPLLYRIKNGQGLNMADCIHFVGNDTNK
jgi:glycosyltransferase involved in cell wall biosynthesis